MVAIYGVASFTTIGQRLDASAVDHHRYDRTSPHDEDAFDVLIDGVALALVPIVLWMGRRRPAVLAGLGVGAAGAYLVASALKPVLPRPDLLPGIQFGNSFPSAHAAVDRGAGLRPRRAGPGPLDGGAGRHRRCLARDLRGLRAHPPTGDVLGGFLLGAVIVAIVLVATSRAARPAPDDPHPSGRRPASWEWCSWRRC